MHGDSPSAATPPHDGPGRVGWSLEWTLPLLISALVAVVVAIFGSAAYEEMRSSSVASATVRLADVSNQLAELARTSTAQRAAVMRRVAGDSATQRLVSSGGDTARVARLIARTVGPADSTLAAIELWSAGGELRFARGEPGTATDRAMRERLTRGAGLRDSLGRSPFYEVGGRVYTWTAIPVHLRGALIGYLAERRRIGDNPGVGRQIRTLTGEDVSVMFANTDGGFWTDLRGRHAAAPFPLDSSRGVFRAIGRDGRPLFAAKSSVAGAPYAIVMMLPESAVLRRPLDFLRRMLGFGLVLVLVGAGGAWALSRHVTRPLRHVTEAAEAVASGRYTHRVAIDRRDELGRLGRTFNSMATRIGASHDELAMRVEYSTALATELAQLNDELRAAEEDTLRAVRRTQRLQSVTGALAGALDVDTVADAFVTVGLDAAGAYAGAIFMVDDDGSALTVIGSAGYRPGPFEVGARIPMDAPAPAAEAARSGEPVYVESPAGWESRYPTPFAARSTRSGAWAALPLAARGRTIGVMGLSFVAATPFDAETRAFLAALAQQCGQALDRALLYGAAVQARNSAEESRRAAQEANRAKSAFLAMMSHELRTPLNAIGGYAELLEMGIRGPVTEAQVADLTRIRSNKDHLLSIINDILNLARIEAGQLSLHLDDVSVDAVLAATESAVAPQIAARRLRYEVSCAGRGYRVRADREKLQQVLLNLVSNAVRFTDAGGLVSLTCVADGDRVRIAVRDTGIGIPPEKLEAIFEPFVQVDSGLTRRTGGTGLGLAISRDLAAAMGGHITVASRVGEGSEFTLTLPRASDAPAESDGDAAAGSGDAARRPARAEGAAPVSR